MAASTYDGAALGNQFKMNFVYLADVKNCLWNY